jgi:hypothetical protein
MPGLFGTDVFKLQNDLKSRMSVFSPFSELSSKMDQWRSFTPKFTGLAPFESMLKQFSVQQKLISQFHSVENPLKSVMERLRVIQQPQLELFEKLNTLQRMFPSNNQFYQINNLQAALGGISAHITRNAILNKKWDLFEDFEEITEEASQINSRIIEQELITREDIGELRNLVKSLDIKIEARDKNLVTKILIWLAILSFIWDAFSAAERFIKEDDHVTKKEFEEFKRDLLRDIKKSNENQKEVRKVTRISNLRLKPNRKSLVLKVLLVDEEVVVLTTNHKWAQVSMVDSDGVVIHGWVYKKYLKNR